MIIKKIRWKNFLSTGNSFIEIDLIKSDTTLFSGNNGSGKSTFLDALTFSLFGKSFRRNNIPQLVNSINSKNCLVEIEFDIGTNNFKIIRGLKPKKFEIYKNNDLIPQDSKSKDYQKILEEQILKMTYKSFCQVVILGSSNYIPFMQLTAADRRGVVENLLDIDIFSTMNTLVRAKLQMTNEQLTMIQNKMEITKNKIDEKEKYINALEKKSNDSVETYRLEIDESKMQIQDLETKVETQQISVNSLLSHIQDKDTIPKNLIKMEAEEQHHKGKIKNIQKNMDFYEDNDVCPSCNQKIELHHKECMVNDNNEEKNNILITIEKLIKQIKFTEKRMEDINVIVDTIQNIEKQISEKNNQISATSQYIVKIQDKIKNILDEEGETSESKNELNQLIGEGKEQFKTRKELIEDKHYYNVASNLLKDTGIKSKIIKHYLPIMNKLINKYLSEMNLPIIVSAREKG